MRKYLSIFILAVWIGLILYLSYQNETDTANTSQTFTEHILRIFMKTEPEGAVLMLWDGRFRTAAHFALFFFYGMISVPIFSEWIKSSFVAVGLAGISGIVLAVLSEAGKIFIAGRHLDYPEMGLNVAGIVTGVIVIMILRLLLHRYRIYRASRNE